MKKRQGSEGREMEASEVSSDWPEETLKSPEY